MLPRPLTLLSPVWVAPLLGLLTIVAACLLQPPAAKPFSHAEHVNEAWRDQREVFRDCRGCHRFSADAQASAPQRHCDDCHAGTGQLQRRFEPAWQKDLSADATRTGPAFRHFTHGMLECAVCHDAGLAKSLAAGEAVAQLGRIYAHFVVETGPGQCARCHGGTVGAEVVARFRWFGGLQPGQALDEPLRAAIGLPDAFTRPADDAAYAQRLRQVFAGPGAGINEVPLPVGGAFDHADHIVLRSGGPGLDCGVCHTDIRRAAADQIGTGSIPVDGCKDCHLRAAGQPARPAADARQIERPLWSLGTFAHADHFSFLDGRARKDGVAGAQGYERVRDQSCAACHVYAPVVPGSSLDFPFDGRSSRHRYADCLGCHDLPAWQTGESLASGPAGELPPLHDSNGGSGWQRCDACHVLGRPDLARERPQTEVQRWTGRVFEFTGQTHPDVTSAGVSRSRETGKVISVEQCAKCHRAVVPELPSRLIERTFHHASHLGAAPTQADCAKCHPAALRAIGSAELADADFRTYSLASCRDCHWGDPVIEKVAPGETAPRRQVASFPHGLHAVAGKQCTDCHVLAGDGVDQLVKPGAAACNDCHRHELAAGATKRPAEYLVGDEVESCGKCHHEGRGAEAVVSVPPPRGSDRSKIDRRYASPQTAFAGFRDAQFHPSGSDCAQCHRGIVGAPGQAAVAFQTVRVPPADHLLVERPGTVHADVGKGGFGAGRPVDCLRCHWKPVSGYDPAVNLQGASPERQLRRLPGSAETRARFGDLFDGYPGTERAKG
ncbi:MAG: cytochrome c3 family protein [Planctomycetes bacterium]|nr:cytochrome c3 family protein [Planctomycetota bacterium]